MDTNGVEDGDDRVVIVGGGIGGLTAALVFLHQGRACAVYERAPEISEIGAGVSLWPPALRVFDLLGLGEAVRALGAPFDGTGIRHADGRWFLRYSSDDLTRSLGEPFIAVHRGELQSLLLGALPDGIVHTDRGCVGIEQDRDRVRVQFHDGSEVAAPIVIGADGQRSAVRAALFGDRPLRDSRYVGWRGTTGPGSGIDWRGSTAETWGRSERFGILPIGGDRLTWYGAARELRNGDIRSDLEERFAHFPPPVPAVIAATPDEQIWTDHIYDRWPLRRWSVGRVTLLGDAAHPMTPELGLGACQAVLDAWALGEELESGNDVESALVCYERRRKGRARLITLSARVAAFGGNVENRALQGARNLLARRTPPSLALRQLKVLAGR